MPTHGTRHQHKDDQANIQMLIAAEQEAQQIVNSARSLRGSRLRQAKEEAERELSQYRASRESDFRKKLSEATGQVSQSNKRIQLQTQAKLQKLNVAASQASSKVTELLIKWVTTCNNQNIIPSNMAPESRKEEDLLGTENRKEKKGANVQQLRQVERLMSASASRATDDSAPKHLLDLL